MQVVCEATQSPDTKVRVAALQCLVKIMSLYYKYMEDYMGPALFAVSLAFSALLRLFFIVTRFIVADYTGSHEIGDR